MMKRFGATLCGAVLVLTTWGSSAFAQQKSVEELRARADAANQADCARVCIDVAKLLLADGATQLSNGDVVAGLQTVSDAVRYAENGGHSSVISHKRQKDAEIALREMIRRLEGVKQLLDADQRQVIDGHIARLQKLRDELLVSMFGNPKKLPEHKQ